MIGTPTATVINALGQQTGQIQYTSPPTVTGSVVTGGGPQGTTMSYDAAGNQTKVTDPAGNAWSYSYDLMNRQVKNVDPDSGTSVTGYDSAGNIAYTTNGAGVTVNYSYDALNRKISEHTGSTTQGSGTLIASWVWDTLKKGRLSSESSVAGGVTYKTGMIGYDSSGNVSGTYVSVPTGQPLAGTYRTQYTYTTTGLMTAQTPAAGGGLPVDSLAYTYDQFGNPTSEKGFDVYVSGAVWTPYNEISQIQLGSGPSSAALTYSYDPQTRNVTGINLSDQQPVPQVDNIAYTYNADRQITQIADTQGGGTGALSEDQCFSYDSLSRLAQGWTSTNGCATDPATGGNGTVGGPQPYWQSWTFDPEGDILTATSHAPAGSSGGDTTATYHYGVTGHAHAVSAISTANTASGSQGSTSYGYDGAGDTTALGGQALTWDPNGKLSADGGTAAYVYNADGNQIMESDTTGGVTTTTLYLPGEQISADGTTTTGIRYYTFAGHVIGETTPTTLYWLNGTAQGTMNAAVAAFSQSSPVIRRASTPYGTMLAGTGTWPDNKGFLGDPAPAATGLVDLGARKFDPATDLFLSVDPMLATDSPQTMTGYTYAADDPSTFSDPSGLHLESCPPEGCGNSGGTGNGTSGCPAWQPGCPGYHAPAPSGGGNVSNGGGTGGSNGGRPTGGSNNIDWPALAKALKGINFANLNGINPAPWHLANPCGIAGLASLSQLPGCPSNAGWQCAGCTADWPSSGDGAGAFIAGPSDTLKKYLAILQKYSEDLNTLQTKATQDLRISDEAPPELPSTAELQAFENLPTNLADLPMASELPSGPVMVAITRIRIDPGLGPGEEAEGLVEIFSWEEDIG